MKSKALREEFFIKYFRMKRNCKPICKTTKIKRAAEKNLFFLKAATANFRTRKCGA